MTFINILNLLHWVLKNPLIKHIWYKNIGTLSKLSYVLCIKLPIIVYTGGQDIREIYWEPQK